ncbi:MULTISPECIES: hypothetical protein [Methylobacterium]|uniref:hypothetical protein n=1 Tax=Methylobacterium TaxID=407 RepID=UPI00272EAFAD|nr:hypothetical protein [Methylobacterium sp.]
MTAAADFECHAEGPAGRILLARKAHDEWLEIAQGRSREDVQRRTKLKKHFEEFVTNGPARLGEDHFRREGAFADGRGASVAIWVFKVWQWRLYGAILPIRGVQCFVGVKVDPSKKRNKADQDLLKAVAKEIGGLAEYRPAHEKGGGDDGRSARKRR